PQQVASGQCRQHCEREGGDDAVAPEHSFEGSFGHRYFTSFAPSRGNRTWLSPKRRSRLESWIGSQGKADCYHEGITPRGGRSGDNSRPICCKVRCEMRSTFGNPKRTARYNGLRLWAIVLRCIRVNSDSSLSEMFRRRSKRFDVCP